MNLATVTKALGGPLTVPVEEKRTSGQLREIRKGIQTMCCGIGLAIFFFLFFHRFGFAAIGAIVFFAGLGRVVSNTVLASPRRSIEFRWPGQSEKRPVQSPQQVADPTQQLKSPPPSVTEDPTVRLEHQTYTPPKERQ